MNCPICGFYSQKHVPAKHLPCFFRCPRCSGYYHLKTDLPSYPEAYFSDSASKTIAERLLSIFLFLRLRRIRRLLPGPGARILDYGCGNGKLVSCLNSRGFSADGYDPSETAVLLARKNNIPVYNSIPNKRYNLIMFWHSLEHSETPLEDVLACKKYLAPHSKLLIAVPNGDSLEAKMTGRTWFCYDWPFHRVHFTPRALKALVEKAGFHIASIDYVNLEYTVSSMAQTFLNLFLPKNVFYSLVSNRRAGRSRGRLWLWGLVSAGLLIIFSPILPIVWGAALMARKTAAFVLVAEQS